jgi:hypothetical protein
MKKNANRTEWFVAKYVGDLRRQETKNVGVVVFSNGAIETRFLGEREDGTIDGRSVRALGSIEIYRAWVEHWRRLAISADGSDALLSRRGSDNFFLDFGGERLLGPKHGDASELATELFEILVGEPGVSAAAPTIAGMADY